MKKKMLILGIVVVFVFAVVVAFILKNKADMNKPQEAYFSGNTVEEGEMVLEERVTKLMSAAESKKEAMEIADMYGITFLSYSDGIATYITEENPQAVIQKGKDMGYPLLEIDHKMKMFN